MFDGMEGVAVHLDPYLDQDDNDEILSNKWYATVYLINSAAFRLN